MSSKKAGVAAPEPTSAPDQRAAAAENVHAIFFVTAEADPALAPRLVEPFAKLGLVPARIHLSAEARSGEEVTADMRLANVSRRTAHLVDKALRRIVGVRQVIVVVQ